MNEVWFYTIIAVSLVSLFSFSGVFFLSLKKEILKNILIYLISFSAGALFADVFFHLLPEVVEEYGFNKNLSAFLLLGILFSFILEKIICWRHCHLPITKNHVHRFAYMNLWGDFFHNFLDGLTIAGSFLLNIPAGIATTLAVIFHEIPQEIGDFGVLLHGGFKIKKALIYNFLTGATAILGGIIGLYFNTKIENFLLFLIPFTSGNFIYIAGSDLIPELHKEVNIDKGLKQIFSFFLGILVMFLLLYLEFK